MSAETNFDRSLWTIVLTVAVAVVVFSFARGPLTGTGGAAAAFGHPLTLWVAGEEAGATEALAQQTASCWQQRGHQADVGILQGDSTQAVDEFLDRARGSSGELLMLTSSTLSQIAYDALRPAGSPARASAQVAARWLLEATPVAVLGRDSTALVVRADSPLHTTAELLELMREHSSRPVLGVAAEAWLEGSLAALAQRAGVEGAMTFSSYHSSREAVASLASGQAGAVLAPRIAVAPGVAAGGLRALPWPTGSGAGARGWVALLAPAGLSPGTVATLRRQASGLCRGEGWRQRLREAGLTPTHAAPTSLRHLIRGGLGEADRLQALAERLVRDY